MAILTEMSVLTNYSTPNDTDWWTIDQTQRIAQSFQINAETIVNLATVRIRGNASNTRDLRVRIETNSGGAPSGTLAGGNLTALISVITSASFDTRTASFGDGNILQPATIYWLVIKCEIEDGTQVNNWSADGAGSYANGNVSSANTVPTWTDRPLYDNWFTIEGPGLSSGLQNKIW